MAWTTPADVTAWTKAVSLVPETASSPPPSPSRLGYYCSSDAPALTEMFDEADDSLFQSHPVKENQCITIRAKLFTHVYLADGQPRSQYNLEINTHNKEVIVTTTKPNERGFIRQPDVVGRLKLY